MIVRLPSTSKRAPRPARGESLSEEVERIIEERAEAIGQSAKTKRLAQQRLAPFVEWAGAQRPPVAHLADADDRVMGRYRDHLASRPTLKGGKLSAQSVYSTLTTIRTILNYAGVERGNFRKPKLQRPSWEDRVLSRGEVERIVRAAKPGRDRLILTVLADTALRVGELLSLRGRDLINDRRGRGGFSMRVVGKVGERFIGLPSDLYNRLRAFADERGDDAAYLFISSRRSPKTGVREPLTVSGVQQIVQQAAEEAKIGHVVNPHALRHAWASNALNEDNISVGVVRDVLGHTSLAMTSRYLHSTRDQQAQAIAAIRR